MKKGTVARWTRMMLCPVTGIAPTLVVGALLTVAQDVWHYYAWYIVALIALLNLFIVRLLCWLLVTSITAALSVLLDVMALRYRRKRVQYWRRAAVQLLRRNL